MKLLQVIKYLKFLGNSGNYWKNFGKSSYTFQKYFDGNFLNRPDKVWSNYGETVQKICNDYGRIVRKCESNFWGTANCELA